LFGFVLTLSRGDNGEVEKTDSPEKRTTMMLISKRADYGVRAMVDVASQPSGDRLIIADIAARQGIPPVFLAKIVPQLAKAGLLKTMRGVKGYVKLGQAPEDINLLQIIEAVEGPVTLNRCTFCPDDCDRSSTCTVYPVWVKAQEELNTTLSSVRLSDILVQPVELVSA
jgi:Rrf2 family protein